MNSTATVSARISPNPSQGGFDSLAVRQSEPCEMNIVSYDPGKSVEQAIDDWIKSLGPGNDEGDEEEEC